ncbi:hypothetical protein ACH5RR_013230 [Cinchona calisaya]|uniref:Uncharacterized protein n=1 Tax=Cinchona calisaya TaxID=153742 RepID=A0ABD3A0T3_9GENT
MLGRGDQRVMLEKVYDGVMPRRRLERYICKHSVTVHGSSLVLTYQVCSTLKSRETLRGIICILKLQEYPIVEASSSQDELLQRDNSSQLHDQRGLEAKIKNFEDFPQQQEGDKGSAQQIEGAKGQIMAIAIFGYRDEYRATEYLRERRWEKPLNRGILKNETSPNEKI